MFLSAFDLRQFKLTLRTYIKSLQARIKLFISRTLTIPNLLSFVLALNGLSQAGFSGPFCANATSSRLLDLRDAVELQ